MKISFSNKPFYRCPAALYGSVALVALAMRLAYAWLAYQQNFFPDLFLDSQHYVGIAKSIVAGRGSGDTAYVMSPLYPYFLSLFIGAANTGVEGISVDGELAVWWVRGVQMLAGIISCVLIASLAKHYAGMVAGWIGGLVSALYGPLIHYETAILVEVMQGFTLIVALWLLVVVRARYTSFNANDKKTLLAVWFMGGVLLGLAAGFRPVALLIVAITIPVIFFLQWLQNKQNLKSIRKKILPCALLLIGTACAVLPFTVRNYVIEKNFVLLSAYGGMNFWIGNHKNATGLFNTPPGYGFHLDPIGVEVAKKTTGKNLSQKEASDWWSERAMTDIKNDPLRWVKLYFTKAFLFSHFREIPQLGNDFHWFAKRAWPLKLPLNALPLLLLALTLPIACLSLQRDLLARTLLPYSWLLIYIAGISLFFITGRYRTPIMPIVFVLAAIHVAILGKYLIVARTYMISLVLIIALLLATFILTKTFNSKKWLPASSLVSGLVERQRGMAAFKQKNFIEAENWYRTSLHVKESSITRGNLANALKGQGRIEEAEKEYRKVLTLTPKDHVVWYNLGNLYRDYKQDPAQAIEYYEKAISINRKFSEPYLNIALLHLRNGNTQQAEKIIEKGLNNLGSHAHRIKEQLIRLRVELMMRSNVVNPAAQPKK